MCKQNQNQQDPVDRNSRTKYLEIFEESRCAFLNAEKIIKTASGLNTEESNLIWLDFQESHYSIQRLGTLNKGI